jgi:hypothetical protein
VLAGRSGHYYRDCVPVVGRSYANSVNIISRNYVAKIVVRITTFILAGLSLSGVMVVNYSARRLPPKPRALPSFLIPVAIFIAGFYDIANGDNLHVALTQERPHIVRTHAADSDGAHSNPAACGHITGLA